MRPLAILCLLALGTSFAAEVETITMADGRVLVGELTPKGPHGATVALIKPKAIITISMDDVKERAPWHEPQLTVYAPGTGPVAEVPKVAHAAAAVKVGRLTELDEQVAAAEERLQAANNAVRELRQKRFRVAIDEQANFIKNGDISTVAVSTKAGATASDSLAVQRAIELNFMLERIGRMRADLRDHGSTGDWNLELDSVFWEKYKEFKHLPRPY